MAKSKPILRMLANVIYSVIYFLTYWWTIINIADTASSWMARIRMHGGPSEDSRGLIGGSIIFGIILLGWTFLLVFYRRSPLGSAVAIGSTVYYFMHNPEFTAKTYEMLSYEPLAWARVMADFFAAAVAIIAIAGLIKMLCDLVKKKRIT